MNYANVFGRTQKQFDMTMNREKITVADFFNSDTKYDVFFRRNQRSTTPQGKVRFFYAQSTPIHIGTIFVLNGENYIVTSQDGIESDIYFTSIAVRSDMTYKVKTDKGSGGSSGGGSAITYAYDTEIATGETWVDGKPIYLKVFHINGSSSQPSSSITFSSYKEQNKFAETIVSVTPLWKSGTRVITGNTIDITDTVSSVTSANENIVQRTLNCWVDNDTKFTINTSKGKRVYSFGCDVFVKYTKL